MLRKILITSVATVSTIYAGISCQSEKDHSAKENHHSHFHEFSEQTTFGSKRSHAYLWDGVAHKTLALTFDDGPSEDETLPIARYLANRGIQATFFVIGDRARNKLDILSELQDLGHLVANHTYDHKRPNTSNVLQAHNVLKDYFTDGIQLFRAPGGAWHRSIARTFNNNGTLTDYVGPFFWDIGGVAPHADWSCRNQLSVKSCARGYFKESLQVGKGIVLLHDTGYGKDTTYTLRLVKELIPRWEREGFRFIRLDRVPGVKRELEKTSTYVGDGGGTTPTCGEPPVGLFSRHGRVLRLTHGARFNASLSVDGKSARKSGHPYKLFVRHSAEDVSNLAFSASNGGEELSGFRYNISWASSPNIEIPFTAQWDCDAWKGTFRYPNGSVEGMAIRP